MDKEAGVVVVCPDEIAEPSLWHFPKIYPADRSARNTLPCCTYIYFRGFRNCFEVSMVIMGFERSDPILFDAGTFYKILFFFFFKSRRMTVDLYLLCIYLSSVQHFQ